MIEIPPSIVANWPSPDLTHPETKGPALPIVVLLLYFTAAFALVVRLLGKGKTSRGLCIEDGLIGIAMIPTTGVTVAVLLSKWKYLLDRHAWDLPSAFYRPASVLASVNFILFCLASTLVRLSFLTFYHRLVKHQNSPFYSYVIYFTIFLSVGSAFGYIFGILFRCSPIKAAYDFYPPLFHPAYPYRCGNREMILFTGSIITTILDFWVMLLPGPVVWKLNLPIKARIGVLGMFFLGLLICTCGLLKSRYIYTLFHTYDESWVACPIWILSAIEIDVGIICSCAPGVRVVARDYLRQAHERPSQRKQSIESSSSLANLKRSTSQPSSHASGDSQPPASFFDV